LAALTLFCDLCKKCWGFFFKKISKYIVLGRKMGKEKINLKKSLKTIQKYFVFDMEFF